MPVQVDRTLPQRRQGAHWADLTRWDTGTAVKTKEGLSPGLVQKETKAQGAGQGPGPELDRKSSVGLGQAMQEGLNHPECSDL